MPFKWTLNPYRGCTHACEYCYARKYQRHLELGAGDEFSSFILVKTNVADVLSREVTRPGWARELVACVARLDPGVKEYFTAFLEREYPSLVEGYGRRYAGSRADTRYAARVREMVYATAARVTPRVPTEGT